MTDTLLPSVILIEDEEDVREAVRLTLELADIKVIPFSRAQPALDSIDQGFSGVVVSDLKMPGMDGMQLLRQLQHKDSDIPVILMTGHGDISIAVEAVQSGAYHFLEKPVAPEQLLEHIKHACQLRQLTIENRTLKNALKQCRGIDGKILGDSPVMQQLRELITNIASANVDVLITGETGTGKELVARTIHDISKHKNKPFVAINCGALPETIIESELFGHEAGAFTGANKRRIGKIESANGGTLFLDEIEGMELHLQIKILRVIQERSLERVGGNGSIDVDIRVIAGSKVDLKEASEQGLFRPDLYYRLNVANIEIPNLKQRISDVPLLFRHFLNKASKHLERNDPGLTEENSQKLMSLPWPGNVRELQHEADRFVLGISSLLNTTEQQQDNCIKPSSLSTQLELYEKYLIEQALTTNAGKVTKAAEYLCIPRKKLYLRMQKFSIDKSDHGQ